MFPCLHSKGVLIVGLLLPAVRRQVPRVRQSVAHTRVQNHESCPVSSAHMRLCAAGVARGYSSLHQSVFSSDGLLWASWSHYFSALLPSSSHCALAGLSAAQSVIGRCGCTSHGNRLGCRCGMASRTLACCPFSALLVIADRPHVVLVPDHAPACPLHSIGLAFALPTGLAFIQPLCHTRTAPTPHHRRKQRFS